MDLFESAKQIGVHRIREWLPGGYEENGQWVAKNPTRNDTNAGSFKINLTTGACNDYADDFVGHDAVSLYAYLNGISNLDAAKEILTKYDPGYFPGSDDFKKADAWYQLTRGHRNAPALPILPREMARWPLEVKAGGVWRVAMYAVRLITAEGEKTDMPYTMFTDGKAIEWRRKALHGVKYPLYGLRTLVENPNVRVLICEGQKTASVVQGVLGAEWACVGWYGGAGSAHMTDWEPMLGREAWFSFDADGPGRKAIKTIIDEHHIKAHLVYPPVGVAKGWDLADAVAEGKTKEDIEAIILADTTALSPMVINAPENRPTRLDVKVSDEFREYVFDNVYEIKEGRDGERKYVLRPDWFFWIIPEDAPLKNCIKYDYTTGTKATAYESSDIFDACIEKRLAELGIPANVVTRSVKERMGNEILRLNSHYNRVADYMDTIILQYGAGDDTVLDEFMNVLVFNVEKKKGESVDDFVTREIHVEKMYRELFHKFFLRMHARIRGTRKDDKGDYLGLIENDIVPILEGPQEIGKTTLCRYLACDDELYIDLGSGLKQGFGSAETVKKIRGRLIAEIGEMKIMKNADSIEVVKSFLSMKAATVDIKYVESQRDIPMTTSFIGTSNPDQYLSDETGNRRFWPVKLKDINKEYMASNKDLPMRLHAHYHTVAMSMNQKEIYDACSASVELRAFMEELRKDALITYSDYEVCLLIIKKWKQNNAMGGSLMQAEVERMAVEDRFMTRISQRSFIRAIKDSGFEQVREWDPETCRVMREWRWTPGTMKQYGDKIPF